MLELTLTTGTELKIGEDIKIVFRGDTTNGRLKVAVEALKEKRIEKLKALEKSKQKEHWNIAAQSVSAKKEGVIIVGNQSSLLGGRQRDVVTDLGGTVV